MSAQSWLYAVEYDELITTNTASGSINIRLFTTHSVLQNSADSLLRFADEPPHFCPKYPTVSLMLAPKYSRDFTQNEMPHTTITHIIIYTCAYTVRPTTLDMPAWALHAPVTWRRGLTDAQESHPAGSHGLICPRIFTLFEICDIKWNIVVYVVSGCDK